MLQLLNFPTLSKKYSMYSSCKHSFPLHHYILVRDNDIRNSYPNTPSITLNLCHHGIPGLHNSHLQYLHSKHHLLGK